MRAFIANSRFPVAVAAAVLLLCSVPSCRPSYSPNDRRPEGDPTQTEQLLDAALDMIQPERLGITAQLDVANSRLNDWLAAVEKATPLPETDAQSVAGTRALLEKARLSTDQLDRLTAEKFDERDVRHIRNCLLLKRSVDSVLQGAGREIDQPDQDRYLDRAVQLFYYTVRNVALEDDEKLPLPLFRVLLFGRGTAEDRAWVFASLLRQLRIDAVILRASNARPAAGDDAAGRGDERWLVGVLLDEAGANGTEKNVYLFDPRLGLPIPAPGDQNATVLVERPATLAQVLEDPAILERLNAGDRRYPITADDLKEPRVEVIGQTSLWAPRMRRLQISLSGRRSAIVYDPLEDSDIGQGMLTRAAEFGQGRWSRDDVSVWPHPESAFFGFEQREGPVAERLAELDRAFNAPVSLAPDPQAKQIKIGAPEREQFKARTAQLTGDYATAIKSYVAIQLANSETQQLPVPADVRQMNAQAAEDAAFWIGVCHMERGDYQAAAVETFPGYMRGHGQQGKWAAEAIYLAAVSLARDGKPRNAVLVLGEAPQQHPQAHGHALLIERWRNLRKP